MKTENTLRVLPVDLRLFVVALSATIFLSLNASSAYAWDSLDQPVHATTVLPAASAYWSRFVDFWSDALKKQNGVVMVVLGIGAISVFIITRSRWRK